MCSSSGCGFFGYWHTESTANRTLQKVMKIVLENDVNKNFPHRKEPQDYQEMVKRLGLAIQLETDYSTYQKGSPGFTSRQTKKGKEMFQTHLANTLYDAAKKEGIQIDTSQGEAIIQFPDFFTKPNNVLRECVKHVVDTYVDCQYLQLKSNMLPTKPASATHSYRSTTPPSLTLSSIVGGNGYHQEVKILSPELAAQKIVDHFIEQRGIVLEQTIKQTWVNNLVQALDVINFAKYENNMKDFIVVNLARHLLSRGANKITQIVFEDCVDLFGHVDQLKEQIVNMFNEAPDPYSDVLKPEYIVQFASIRFNN